MRARDLGWAAFAAMVALGACGPSAPARTPSGARASCASDSDCVVTTFAGCCACCPDAPHAVPRAALDAQKARCSAVDCAPCSERVGCREVASAAGLNARCKDGTCAVARE